MVEEVVDKAVDAAADAVDADAEAGVIVILAQRVLPRRVFAVDWEAMSSTTVRRDLPTS